MIRITSQVGILQLRKRRPPSRIATIITSIRDCLHLHCDKGNLDKLSVHAVRRAISYACMAYMMSSHACQQKHRNPHRKLQKFAVCTLYCLRHYAGASWSLGFGAPSWLRADALTECRRSSLHISSTFAGSSRNSLLMVVFVLSRSVLSCRTPPDGQPLSKNLPRETMPHNTTPQLQGLYCN